MENRGSGKLKLQLVSDLHLEFGEWPEVDNAGADVLILSGDICTAHDIEKFKPFFEYVCKEFEDVVYVSGNHEYYRGDIKTTDSILSELGYGKSGGGLHFLQNDACYVGGHSIFGATLWTDCNDNDVGTKLDLKSGLNDYRLITNGDHRLAPSDTIQLHKATLSSLEWHLSEYPNLDIVVGHHAPSKKSIHPRYKTDFFMNGGFVSDLEPFILDHPQIKLWTHGHTHDSFDYKVGETRVVANPAGYPKKGRDGLTYRENINFNSSFIIEV